VLRAEVPGVAEKDLELQVQENTVSLRGERKEAIPEGHSVHRKERGDFRFARSFQLPSAVAADKVEAHLKNGVLTVTLPKAETAKPRKISVRSS
jgi:HSP20 family protein